MELLKQGGAFLDRDGTLNVQPLRGDYIRCPSELVLLEGAAHAVRMFNERGVPVVLVTNQRWLSFPEVEWAAYEAVDRRLAELLAADGAHLDGHHVCPHAFNTCSCRKPQPGMLLRGAAELDLDLRASLMIGDAAVDSAAGRAVGAHVALVHGAARWVDAPRDVPRFSCLDDAAHWALREVFPRTKADATPW